MDQGLESQVRDALREASGWKSIDELIEHVSAAVEVPIEFSKRAVTDSLKRLIRRQIKQFKDGDGLSQWESIERADADGDTQRVYKQLSLFTRDDYRVAIGYYSTTGSYHIRKANTLTKRCNATHKTRLPLPFPQFGLLADGEQASA